MHCVSLRCSTPSTSCACHPSVALVCVWFGSTSLVREVQWDVRVHCSSCGAHVLVVHIPFEWFYHRCHCNSRDPDSAAPMCCRSVCVAMSCGGGFYTPDGAYDSVWDSVRPLTGKYTQLFLVPRGCGCVCMLNGWFSSNDTICADNYIYFRFKLQACVAVRSGSCICTAILPSWWTVMVWKCCPGVCLRLGFHPIWQRITPSLSCAAF